MDMTTPPSHTFFPGTDTDICYPLNDYVLVNPDRTSAAQRVSILVSRTQREASSSDVSKNAQLLVRAGYIQRLQSGIYTLLPLGQRVLAKIESEVRKSMESLGSQEVMFSVLQPRELLDKTGRWNIDVIFKLKGRGDKDLSLAFTNEEACAHVIGPMVGSHRALPQSVFQIQSKFRDEPRAKSGLLRGKEFRMKDMYSFHASQDDLNAYYDHVHGEYMRLYDLFGIGNKTYLTFASGGDYSPFSHEYQTLCDAGEDTIYISKKSGLAINREIFEKLKKTCPVSGDTDFTEHKAIEVGNIFKLGTRFTDAYGYFFTDTHGEKQPIYMASYGIGLTRVLGTVAELLSDEDGLIWPRSIAPYQVMLVSLVREESDKKTADTLFEALSRAGVEVLYDDRHDHSAGIKLKESDLLGIPDRIVISRKSLDNGEVEVKNRKTGKVIYISIDHVVNYFQQQAPL